jgi:hypothetical protein
MDITEVLSLTRPGPPFCAMITNCHIGIPGSSVHLGPGDHTFPKSQMPTWPIPMEVYETNQRAAHTAAMAVQRKPAAGSAEDAYNSDEATPTKQPNRIVNTDEDDEDETFGSPSELARYQPTPTPTRKPDAPVPSMLQVGKAAKAAKAAKEAEELALAKANKAEKNAKATKSAKATKDIKIPVEPKDKKRKLDDHDDKKPAPAKVAKLVESAQVKGSKSTKPAKETDTKAASKQKPIAKPAAVKKPVVVPEPVTSDEYSDDNVDDNDDDDEVEVFDE